MNRFLLLLLIPMAMQIQGCNSGVSSGSEDSTATVVPDTPQITAPKLVMSTQNYQIINLDNSSNKQVDVYVKVSSKITGINEQLKAMLDVNCQFLEINYYDNKKIAKTYMAKQNDPNISDDEKDRLFAHFIAVYKHNHSTGFDQLSFQHQ